ncbi:putative serine/threonine-protein kinase Nek5-like isoform X3 [Apostichopus japonicus]|uniref:non-specific serine/threonine protein kinase n=1 Tax=Stichopus japonicus TaxID=307972 RepID=A0A2G8JPM3_STIJA|nr:putative serine/threonine-protein kinase Nek5-like isoform X3 [Apostichopus japonicus]
MGKLKSVGRYIMEDRTLGKGNFAVVELASHIITSSKVAVKIIDRRKLKEEYMQKNLYREAKVMSKLRHPNIARLYETIKSNNLYFLVTEYVAGGDLLSYVRNQKDGYLSESRSRVYVRQLVSALHHLHERGVVHRDLKMENIILDAKRKNLKLIDFGLSNHYNTDQLLKTHCGSPEYAAPELFVTGREYGPEIDIWSFGIIVYAMVTGKLPFTAPHTENRRQRLLQLINAGLGPIHERDMRNITEDCKDLLRRSIQPSETRIHLLDIQVHPWITANNQDTFYPFQQPPRDPRLKEEVIEKMASLLTVTKSMLEGNVHETRCDELGAMFNLLMDDALRERGLWEGDHTRRRDRPDDSCRVMTRSPEVANTFRFMPIPKSVDSTNGNATTVNIILARQQHFPRPSTQPAKLQHRPVSKTKSGTRPRSCINTPETLLVAPHPSSAELLLSSKDSAATPNQPSHQDGEQISDQKATPKTPDTPETTSSRSKRDMTHKELQTVTSSHSRDMGRKESDQKSVKEPVKKASYTPSNGPVGTKPRPKLQVVDMARHFNAKHGYQVSETPILVQNGPAVSPGATVRKSPAKPHSSERRASLNLCDGHLSEFRENDLSKDDSSGDRRHSIAVANISEKSRKQRSATPVLLRLRHRDGKEAAHQEPSELRKSRVKKGDARRHSLGVTRDLSQSRSSGISSYVPSRSQTPSISETMTSSSQNSRPGTSRNPSRSLYKTPIASVIASDGNLAHRSRRERRASDSVGEMTVKSPTGMPSRLEWKRTSSAERKIATQSLNMTKEKTSGYTSEGNSRGCYRSCPTKP